MESNEKCGQGNRILDLVKKVFTIEWLTLAMIIVAVVNSFQTKAMIETTRETTKATKDAYIAENRPYLAFNGLEAKIVNGTNAENSDLRVSIQLQNIGKSILIFNVTNLKIAIDDGKNIISPKDNSEGGCITLFPGQNINYKCEVISGVDMTKVVNGTLEYDIDYDSKEIKGTYSTHRKARITIYPNGDNEVDTYEGDEN